MPRLRCTPSARDARPGRSFVQTVELIDRGAVVGFARWHSPATGGISQLLEIQVSPEVQRIGHGSRLLTEVFSQAAAVGFRRGEKVRLLWCLAEQKSQIIFRGFLFKHGFHHVASPKRLLVGQDAMVYVKSFD